MSVSSLANWIHKLLELFRRSFVSSSVDQHLQPIPKFKNFFQKNGYKNTIKSIWTDSAQSPMGFNVNLSFVFSSLLNVFSTLHCIFLQVSRIDDYSHELVACGYCISVLVRFFFFFLLFGCKAGESIFLLFSSFSSRGQLQLQFLLFFICNFWNIKKKKRLFRCIQALVADYVCTTHTTSLMKMKSKSK